MKKNLLFLSVLMFVFSIASISFAQYQDARRWTHDPRMTQITPFDQGVPYSQESANFKNPNKKPMVKNTPIGMAVVSPNFRVHPSGTTQSEVPIVSSYVNTSMLFGSANTARFSPGFFLSEGVYLSTDGGNTWSGTDTLNGSPITNHGGDPGPAIGPDGTLYMSHLGYTTSGIFANRSTDMGQTWSSNYTIIGGSQDKNHTVVNDVASSAYYGTALVSWSLFSSTNPPIDVSYTTNDGTSWSTPIQVNTPDASHYSQGVNGAVAPNGDFYLVWQNPISGSPYTGDFVGFAKSTDGGATWTYNNNVYDCNGIRGNLSNKAGIRVNDFPWMGVDRSGGPRNGWIYVVTAEKNLAPAGSDPDIVMHRSTDGGTTWSAGIRVNQDLLNNGVDQYMPALCVGHDGSVNVVYYDSRNTTTDSAQVYVSRSDDGGDTWTDVQVSDHSFKPSPIPGLAGGYQGDYIGIAESDGVYYPFWADNFSGIYQAWTAAVTFEPPCPVEAASNPTPPNGSVVPANLATLSWQNGAGANTNELYFGQTPGTMILVQSGALDTSWAVTGGPLPYNTSYYWQVKEIGDTCTKSGPIWSFTTEQDPNLVQDTLFMDDFTAGCGNWTITNDGGTCVWDCNHDASEYQLGSTPAAGTVMAADVDFCGSGTSLLSTATLNTPIDATNYTTVTIEWDQDFRTLNTSDDAYVEASTDGGSTWQEVASWLGVDSRDVHVSYDITSMVAGQSFLVRYRSVQPGWDWWWAVDNIKVVGQYIQPVEFTAFNANINEGKVSLNWSTSTETNNKGFEVQRKSENGNFERVGFVNGAGSTTDPQSYSYTDSKVNNGNYSYRLKQVDFNGSFSYSKEVNVKVDVPLQFALDQNYPNPFNPSTQIKYSIPQDAFVTLTVYNSLGQKVATLVNGTVKAGQHNVNFNASNIASGVYFYRLEANNKVSVKKMMLLK